MAGASYLQSSFIGGLVSKFAQGRYHDQHYRTWLETCLNGLPVQTESWVRRPGFGFAGTTRGGLPARIEKFDFEAAAPYTLEFTDAHLRFWQANVLADTNDSVGLSSISVANPAVMTLASAVTWATGDEVYLTGLGTTLPVLQNRRFTITKVDSTHFSIADSVTGQTISGTGFGAPAATAMVNHVLDISTLYTAGTWSSLRVAQTEDIAFLLHSQFAPQELVVTSQPSNAAFAAFSLAAAIFQDGPYLDAFTNGAQITPNATTGIVECTLSFPTWVSTTSYAKGSFVTSASVNYESLQDQNVGNTPASSPTFWLAVNSSAAVNNGQGFTATDIGRLVRLLSEPPAWVSSTTYSAGQLVTYNPTGLPGGATYWESLISSNTGNVPGASSLPTGSTPTQPWALAAPGAALPAIGNAAQTQAQASGPAQWTWGKIVSLVNLVPNDPAGVAFIGNMTGSGGLSAAFNGVTTQSSANCASLQNNGSLTGFVGENFSGAATTAYAIQSVTVFPSSNEGLAFVSAQNGNSQPSGDITTTVTVQLYGKNSNPANATDGTLLGSVTLPSSDLHLQGFLDSASQAIGTSAITINSNNTASTFSRVWVTVIVNLAVSGSLNSFGATAFVGQVQFVNAQTGATGNGINVEILGPTLLYTNVITNWRLGLYSNTTGWPNVGTYAEGRLWLSSAGFPNRVDACVADGISGANNSQPPGTVNFAPTDQWGNVTAANAISAVFNAPDTNPILWMIPDLQGVLAGTLGGEWIIQAPSSGPIAPNNIVARRMTLIGCANIEPRRTEHTIIFVQRFLRKIVEFFADVFSGKFTAPDLNKDAKNLTIGNIQQIAYQQELVPIIWARVNNGLIGATYKRDTLMTSSGPTMNGWHQHQLGSNRAVESIVVGSSVNGTLDALMAVTNDPAANVRFVEVLSPILDEGTLQSAAAYLDEAIVPSSTVAIAVSSPNFPYGGLQLNGLWPLNGYTVTAWLGGLDLGDYTVVNGSISVPYGDGIASGGGTFPASSGANRNDQGLFTSTFVSTGVTANGNTLWTGTMPMLVGFTFTSQGRIVRPNAPAESGARSGPAFGKLRRSHWIMAQFEGTQGVSWGTEFNNLLPARLPKFFGGPVMTVDMQFTGITRDNLTAEYTFDNRLAWQVTRPYICNLQTIGAALETQDI